MSAMDIRLTKAQVGSVLKKKDRLYVVATHDIIYGGNVLEITLSPIADPLTSVFLWLTGQLRVAEEQIDEFEMVGSITNLDY